MARWGFLFQILRPLEYVRVTVARRNEQLSTATVIELQDVHRYSVEVLDRADIKTAAPFIWGVLVVLRV